jgi:hypothetical protein
MLISQRKTGTREEFILFFVEGRVLKQQPLEDSRSNCDYSMGKPAFEAVGDRLLLPQAEPN